MTVKSLCKIVLCLTTLQCTSLAWADDDVIKRSFTIETTDDTVMAIKPDVGPIELQLEKFKFNWNDQATVAASIAQISVAEKFIANINDVPKLNANEQQALGKLLYSLGTYYSHIARDPDSAIAKLTVAAPLLTTKEEKAWNDDQLAYAYAQKYAANRQSVDKEKSLFYANKVLSVLYPQKQNKITAFAFGVKGLLESDDKNYTEAEKSFSEAIAIHEKLPQGKDDQCARLKNRLATTILDQNIRDQEGLKMLLDVKKYWSKRGSVKQDPYAARNLVSLGHAYLKTGDAKAARDEFKTAISIYKNIYGANTVLLVKPYQLLAEAYRKLGSLEQASIYEKQANDIINA